MKEILYCISTLLISVAASGQTDDKRALDYYNNGCYLVARKNYIGAVANFTEAIKRDSDFIQAYENRGVAKYYLNDHKGAIADYNIALKINPDDYSTYGRRGWAKFCLQDYREAITDFNKAIKGKWDNAGYFNIRGQAKYRIQDYEGAIADFNKVIRSLSGGKDDRSKAFFWRGLVKIDLGQKESACLDFRESGKLGHAMANELLEIYCH